MAWIPVAQQEWSWYPGRMDRQHRMERVNELLRTMLSELILEKYTTNDLVTLVDVRTTRDLKAATVFVSATEHLQDHVDALNRLAPELQQLIKPKLDFTAIPALTFKADETGDQISKVEDILDRL